MEPSLCKYEKYPERLNLEPNRIAKEIGAFPDDESITGRRSMNMEAIWSCVGSFRNYSDSCTLSQRLLGNSVKKYVILNL